ncbi:His Kinase A (phospho-acceptor) domain-containing protein [Phyllobacterium sp. YR620]|uniref:GAF domain-containing sensor histidine kinase n=1 Tax=Phyllobacterium sp. YR620 TaxID=1881066 RepID=UPI00089030F3|nr:GAF domain-containing sensor histidine kinase [Phyllobacterium sp. YR620]SDP55444.1 His Kinase A (phospho-acceptor) domain-containing protein [Phyllobacterium sp. YR620]
MPHDFQADIDAIARIDAVPTILDVVCRTTGMGFAAVARVTEDRWIACQVLDNIAFGLKPGGELEVKTTICDEIRGSGQAVVIDEVSQDLVYSTHHTPQIYGFQSYISMPITLPDGTFFGTLCAIDPAPARLKNPQVVGMFKLFADLIAFHLDANDRLAKTEAALVDERTISEFREQFVAVLGHDLRNPVASIDSGTRLLLRTPLDEKAEAIVKLIRGSVVRMSGLIDNVMDLARARLGSGVMVEIKRDAELKPTLTQVVDELGSVRPDRVIETSFEFDDPIRSDPLRVGQLLSNLLGNALAHGSEDGAILVDARTTDDAFELSVTNRGEPIPAESVDQLFLPFFRHGAKTGQQGLGLGLYIASEIAKLHGGVIEVDSNDGKTRFTFRMPLEA